MDNDFNPIQLINGRLVDISKLSLEELDDLLTNIDGQIASLEKQIEDEIFAKDNVPIEEAFGAQSSDTLEA